MLVNTPLTQHITPDDWIHFPNPSYTNEILLTLIASHLGGKEIIHAPEGLKLIHSD